MLVRFLLLIGPVMADLKSILSIIQAELDRNSTDRNWSKIVRNNLVGSDIWDGYGCWCYFDGHWGLGKGQAVSQVDQFCKELQ